MRKALSSFRTAVWFFPIALGFLTFDIITDSGGVGPRQFLAIALRFVLWFLPLPIELALLEWLTARIRHDVLDVAATVLVAAFAAILSDCLFVAIISRLGPPRYLYITPFMGARATLSTAFHYLEQPLPIVLGVLLAARWTAARAAERDAVAHASRLQARLSEARLHLLSSQLHPHFLFNSLNSVAALIRSDVDGASRMLERLRRFYSAASLAGARESVPLEQELSLVAEYLGIEQVRFGSRLSVAIRCDADVRNASVPALFLQPLVENAVRHGISRVPGHGFVRIDAGRVGETLRIVVENGAEATTDERRGVGLANTLARLEQTYGDKAAMRIASEGERFRVAITLPLRLALAEAA